VALPTPRVKVSTEAHDCSMRLLDGGAFGIPCAETVASLHAPTVMALPPLHGTTPWQEAA
jgi:hypothetical protein